MGRKKRDCIWVMVKSLARFLVIHWISYCISIIYNTWTVLTQFKFQEMLKFCLYIKGLGMGWVGEWTGGMTPQKLDLFREGIGRPPPPPLVGESGHCTHLLTENTSFCKESLMAWSVFFNWIVCEHFDFYRSIHEKLSTLYCLNSSF